MEKHFWPPRHFLKGCSDSSDCLRCARPNMEVQFSAPKIHTDVRFPFSNRLGCCSFLAVVTATLPNLAPVNTEVLPSAVTDPSYSFIVVFFRQIPSERTNNRAGWVQFQWTPQSGDATEITKYDYFRKFICIINLEAQSEQFLTWITMWVSGKWIRKLKQYLTETLTWFFCLESSSLTERHRSGQWSIWSTHSLAF